MRPTLPKSRIRLLLPCLLLLASFLPGNLAPANAAATPPYGNPSFLSLWNRTDQQVASGQLSRTFLWGPAPFTTALMEDYAEAPGGKRLVQYFDKSRMELTNPAGDKSNPFYVTNGLLVNELISGREQVGDSKFINYAPANVNMAGDQDDQNGPTYASLGQYGGNFTAANTDKTGQPVYGSLLRNSVNVNTDSSLSNKYGVSLKYFEPSTKHNIANPFWDFLNQTAQVQDSQGQVVTGRLFDPVYYATGLPISEPFWTRAKVAGVVQDVLMQAFERRVLTFTPANDPAYQVEMGNVGQHYYTWRTSNRSAVQQPSGSDQINLSGTSTTASDAHSFASGLTYISVTHSGNGSFSATLNGPDSYTVAHGSGSINTNQVIAIKTAGTYVLNVQDTDNGSFTILVYGSDSLNSTPAGPNTHRGNGTGLAKFHFDSGGVANLKFTNDSMGQFNVTGYNLDGSQTGFSTQIAPGSSTGSFNVNVSGGDVYFLVESHGAWTLN